MTNEEFDKQIERETELLNKWLEENDNLMDRPISEILGDAFFTGYEAAMKELNK